jgi:hypothetical protein
VAADIRRLLGGLALPKKHPVKQSQVLGCGGLTAVGVESAGMRADAYLGS